MIDCIVEFYSFYLLVSALSACGFRGLPVGNK